MKWFKFKTKKDRLIEDLGEHIEDLEERNKDLENKIISLSVPHFPHVIYEENNVKRYVSRYVLPRSGVVPPMEFVREQLVRSLGEQISENMEIEICDEQNGTSVIYAEIRIVTKGGIR